MRYGYTALVLAAALLAVSCAGLGPSSGPRSPEGRGLSVELDDLRAYDQAVARRAAPARLGAATPLPDSVPLDLTFAAPGRPVSRPRMTSLPPDPLLGPSGPAEVSSARPSRFSRPLTVRLPLPPDPAVAALPKPKGKKPSAQAPASGPAAKALPPSGKTQSSPGVAPAPPAVSAAASASPRVAATGGAAGPTARDPGANAPSGRIREIYARTGDEVEIGLDGAGFVFLGFPAGTPADGVSFKSKDLRDGKSYFKFKASRLGTYDLAFLQQDNVSGRSSKETVRVHVVSDADFAAAVETPEAGAADQPPNPEPGDPEYAEKLAALGKYEAALGEYLKGYREGDGKLNDRIASLYLLTGSDEAAEKYFRKNLSPAGPYSEKAVIGLVGIALDRKDAAGFLELLKPLLDVREANIEEPLIRAARFQQERGDAGLGLELVGQYLRRYPDGAHGDEADFIQAGLLEMDSPRRDIQKARDLYREILQRFPESPFAGPARDRLRYIEQHFYLIR